VPQDSAGTPANTCKLSYAQWEQQQRDFTRTFYGEGTYNDNATDLNRQADYLEKQAADWRKFAEHTLSVARGYDELARRQLNDNRPEDAKSSIAERERLSKEAEEEVKKADELSKEAAELRARAGKKQPASATQPPSPTPVSQPALPCLPPENPSLTAGGDTPKFNSPVRSPIVPGGLRFTNKNEYGETRVADYDSNFKLAHETFYNSFGKVIGETVASQTVPGGYTTTYADLLGRRTVTEWTSEFDDTSEYDRNGVLRWRDRVVYDQWDEPTYEIEEGYDAQGHLKYRDIYEDHPDGTTSETYQDFNADGTAQSRTVIFKDDKVVSDTTTTLTAEQLNAKQSSLQTTLNTKRTLALSWKIDLHHALDKYSGRTFAVGGSDINLKLDFKYRLDLRLESANAAGQPPRTDNVPGAFSGTGGPDYLGLYLGGGPWDNDTSFNRASTADPAVQTVFTDTEASEGTRGGSLVFPNGTAIPETLLATRSARRKQTADRARSAGALRLTAFHPGASRAALGDPGPKPQSSAAAPAPSAPTDRLEASIVSNGKTGDEAFQIQVFDPSGKMKQIRMPAGVVLEPVKPGGDVPKPVAQRHAGAGGLVTQPIGALCLDFAKLPPAAGMLYRIAPQAVQEKLKPLRSILQAGHSLAENGRLHPDSDPKEYATFIRQFALWTKIENWDAQKFTEMFVERSKKNAQVMNVPWSKGMEDALRSLAPGRWQDITAVLNEAETISKSTAAKPAD
jgi:hypothetical protein